MNTTYDFDGINRVNKMKNEGNVNQVLSSRPPCYPVEIVYALLHLLTPPVIDKITAELEMEKKRLLIILGLMLTLTARLASKNLTIGTSYNGYYSDNIFMNASAVTDYVSQLQAELNFSMKKLSLYLDASADIYNENGEFNAFQIEPGVEFIQYLKGRSAIYLTLGYMVLDYKELFSDFNYSGPRVQANLKLHTSSRSILKAGYLFEYRNYPNYESFDFFNHKAFVEFNRFFKSQTTLRVQTGFNFRYYPHIVQNFDFGDDYNYYDNTKSQGKWKHKVQGSGSGPNNPPGTDGYEYESMGVPNVYGLLHVTQSVGTRVGITAEAEIRKNFRGLDDADALLKNSYIIYPYNDDYLWDGLRLSLALKTALFSDVALEGMVAYYDKNYRGVYVMDEDGSVVEPAAERKDSLLLYKMKISKKFGKLDVFGNISYRQNTSADDYFLYNMLTISAGIGYYFQGVK
jgi:hypothetical protein